MTDNTNIRILSKRFEELTIEDLYEILRCRSEVFVVEQKCPYQDLDELDRYSTHLYIEDGGRILTYLRIIDPGIKSTMASIGRLLTIKEVRGEGLARFLMTEAIRMAKGLSPAIDIEAQAYLSNFYRSLGFVETSEEFLLDNIPHVKMRLE